MAPGLTELREGLDKALRNVAELLELSGLLPDVPIGQEENQNWIFSSPIDPQKQLFIGILITLFICLLITLLNVTGVVQLLLKCLCWQL